MKSDNLRPTPTQIPPFPMHTSQYLALLIAPSFSTPFFLLVSFPWHLLQPSTRVTHTSSLMSARGRDIFSVEKGGNGEKEEKRCRESQSRYDFCFSSLMIIFFLLFDSPTASSLGYNSTSYKSMNSFRLARIQRHLDKINKPPLRTIQSLDGDTIDCVQMHKQLALDHPLLKDHQIQIEPRARPKLNLKRSNYSSSTGQARGAWQTWHKSGHCPRGKIPVRRTSSDDIVRAKSIFHYGKKTVRRRPENQPAAISIEVPDVISSNVHEHAIAYTGSGEFYGAKATINVWDPSIEGDNEFSLSQMWVLSGSFDGSDRNSIESGWQVSPELYGDNRPRLFTYWTSDAYQETGCYNLLCSGFVQTNSRIAIGASISPISSYEGNQYDITILIWKVLYFRK